MERSQERGQAILMFALVAVVVLGMAALAVDVGWMYVSRRHVQNVADQAALVGAQNLPSGDVAAETAAELYASQNLASVLNVGTTTVTASAPPTTGPHSGESGYIEVTVQRQLPVLFAGVLLQGPTVTVPGRAVATILPGSSGGAAILALDDDDLAIRFGGTADLLVEGGVWSNGGINVAGSSTIDIDGSIGSFGPLDIDGGPDFEYDELHADTGTLVGDPLASLPPPPYSGSAANFTTAPPLPGDDYRIANPGFYRRIDVGPSEQVKFRPGVYVVEGDVTIRGDAVGWAAAGDPPNNLRRDDVTWGTVSFYLIGSGSKFAVNAGANVRFDADSTNYRNVVVWVPNATGNALQVNGGADIVRLRGTVYAPNGEVTLNGTADGPQVVGQVIANTIVINGDNGSAVEYDSDYAAPWSRPRLVE